MNLRVNILALCYVIFITLKKITLLIGSRNFGLVSCCWKAVTLTLGYELIWWISTLITCIKCVKSPPPPMHRRSCPCENYKRFYAPDSLLSCIIWLIPKFLSSFALAPLSIFLFSFSLIFFLLFFLYSFFFLFPFPFPLFSPFFPFSFPFSYPFFSPSPSFLLPFPSFSLFDFLSWP